MFPRLLFALVLTAPTLFAEVTARYIRVENPMGFVMEFRQVEVFSGGRNVILKHPEMVHGSLAAPENNPAPTRENTILRDSRAAGDITNGGTDVSQRAPREMGLTGLSSPEPHAARFRGFLRVPSDGLYTFHAPAELARMGGLPATISASTWTTRSGT